MVIATDSATQLERLGQGVRRRRRRTLLVTVALAVLGAGATALGLSLSGGTAQQAKRPSAPAAVAPTVARGIPAWFPTGEFALPGSTTGAGLQVVDSGAILLRVMPATAQQPVTFPTRHTIVFHPDGWFCQVSGTYRFRYAAGALTFAVVHDPCHDRVQFLHSGAFTAVRTQGG
jgi:hypothetical protein